jgi:hypothetical protein
MSAVFYFDDNGRAQAGQIFDPAKAISILRGEVATNQWYRLCGSLIELAGGQPGVGRSINLRGRDAVLMMGTTPELQAGVAAAIADGVNGVFVPDDYLVIYYLRYAEPGAFMTTTNRTVACIAGRQGYWGLAHDQQDDTNVQNAGWAPLYPTTIPPDQWIFNGSMPLQTLHQVLGRLSQTPSWYNERGERIV